MKLVRQLLTFFVSGALAGVLLISYGGPRFIEWDQRGLDASRLPCLCAETARQGAQLLLSYQMKGMAVGAVGGLLLGIAWAVVRRKKKVDVTEASPPAAS